MTTTLKNTDDAVNAVRYAVRARGTWAKFVADNSITRDMIADTARELATLAYPTDEPVQKKDGERTRFGNAVQAAGNGMRSVLDAEEKAASDPDWIKLMRQAVDNAATKGEFSAERILSEVREVLRGENADLTAAA